MLRATAEIRKQDKLLIVPWSKLNLTNSVWKQYLLFNEASIIQYMLCYRCCVWILLGAFTTSAEKHMLLAVFFLAVGSRFCFWQEAVRSEVHRTVHAGEVGPASVVKEVRVSSFAQHLLSCIQQEHNNHSKCASHENITIHHLLFVVQMENCVTLLSLFLTRHSVRNSVCEVHFLPKY